MLKVMFTGEHLTKTWKNHFSRGEFELFFLIFQGMVLMILVSQLTKSLWCFEKVQKSFQLQEL
jgi:hypothetical protein